MFGGRKTRLSGTNKVGFGTAPVSSWSRSIVTNDVMDATDLELRRLRYDYRLPEHFCATGAKAQATQRVTGLTAAGPDALLYMWQRDSGD